MSGVMPPFSRAFTSAPLLMAACTSSGVPAFATLKADVAHDMSSKTNARVIAKAIGFRILSTSRSAIAGSRHCAFVKPATEKRGINDPYGAEFGNICQDWQED